MAKAVEETNRLRLQLGLEQEKSSNAEVSQGSVTEEVAVPRGNVRACLILNTSARGSAVVSFLLFLLRAVHATVCLLSGTNCPSRQATR